MTTDDAGRRIARRRQELRWTQADLAERLGVHKDTVVSWETGKHYPKRYLGAIEALLGISLHNGQHADFTPETEDEALIWSFTRFSKRERRILIDALREARQ